MGAKPLAPGLRWGGTLWVGYLLLSSCAQVPPVVYPTIPDVRQIDLRWQPTAGMRLAYQVTTAFTAGGPAAQSLPANQRSQRGVTTRVMDITSVGPDFFEVRFSEGETTIPASMRFSRSWAPLDIRLDDPQALTEKDRDAMKVALQMLQDLFAPAAQYFSHWTVNETRPFSMQFPSLPNMKTTVTGEVTFRRVVSIRNRAAAEFHGTARGEVTLEGGKGRVDVTSWEWVDLATGVRLVTRSTGQGQFSGQGQQYQFEMETHEELDFTGSRGL